MFTIIRSDALRALAFTALSVIGSADAWAQAPTNKLPLGVSGTIVCDGKGNIGISIDINGKITTETAREVENLFKAFHAAKQGDKHSCTSPSGDDDFSAFGTHFGINSNGGNVIAAMEIGRLFRNERVWLGVDGYCISSCVLILAGAVNRHVSRDNLVGIHRPYQASGPVANPSEIATTYSSLLAQIKSYLREMNVSTRLATDMLAIEPEAVRMLSLKELQSYRLLDLDPAEQERRAVNNEIDNLKEAERLGLDRIEYNKRKALANTRCSIAAPNDYRGFHDCYSHIMKTGAN